MYLSSAPLEATPLPHSDRRLKLLQSKTALEVERLLSRSYILRPTPLPRPSPALSQVPTRSQSPSSPTFSVAEEGTSGKIGHVVEPQNTPSPSLPSRTLERLPSPPLVNPQNTPSPSHSLRTVKRFPSPPLVKHQNAPSPSQSSQTVERARSPHLVNPSSPPPRPGQQARPASLNITFFTPQIYDLTSFTPTSQSNQPLPEKDIRRRRITKLRRMLGEDIHPDLLNQSDNRNSFIGEDHVSGRSTVPDLPTKVFSNRLVGRKNSKKNYQINHPRETTMPPQNDDDLYSFFLP